MTRWGPIAPQWRRTADELPLGGAPVLALIWVRPQWSHEILRYENGKWLDDEWFEKDAPDWWQPLPAPPEQEAG